jgi:histone H3/H4
MRLARMMRQRSGTWRKDAVKKSQEVVSVALPTTSEISIEYCSWAKE